MYLSIGYEADKHMSIINGKPTALTQFTPMFPFCTPWKRQKTRGFLTFSGGIEMRYCLKMGSSAECVQSL